MINLYCHAYTTFKTIVIGWMDKFKLKMIFVFTQYHKFIRLGCVLFEGRGDNVDFFGISKCLRG